MSRRPKPSGGLKRYPMIVDESGRLHRPESCSVVWVTVDEEREWEPALDRIGYLDKTLEHYEAEWLRPLLGYEEDR